MAVPGRCATLLGIFGLWLLPAIAWCKDGPSPSRVYFDEIFAAKRGAWISQNAQVADGQLILSCPSDGLYDGVQTVFTPAVAIPVAGKGILHLEITLAGAKSLSQNSGRRTSEPVASDGSGTSSKSPGGRYSTRIFLIPGVAAPRQFVDPYGMPHVLALYVDGDEQGAVASLRSRSGDAKSGRHLFGGSVTAKSFPLAIHLRLDRETYRLQFGSEVETRTGSRSGHHNLAEAPWQGDATFALRLVNLTKGNKPQLCVAKVKAALEPAVQVRAQTPARPPSRPPADLPGAAAAVVRVHPKVIRSVGGYDQVQSLFGGNVNGSTGDKATAILSALNLNTSRMHIFADVYSAPPEKQAPVTPSWSGQFGVWMGRKPLAPEEVGPAWDKWFAQDFSLFLDPAMERGVRTLRSQESQLHWAKAWGNTAGAVFFPAHRIDGNALRHLDGACRFYEQFLNAVTKHAPWLEARFLQLTNEPNYPWWTGSFKDEPSAVTGWIELFNAVDAHLRKTHPQTRLLGPCLASEAFFSFGGWQAWTVPVLRDMARGLEYFNYHNYAMAAWSHLAWVEMLQAQAEALGRPRPRAVVTEINDGADCRSAGRKFEWWSEQFFMALENPDKIHLWSYFLLAVQGADQWGNVATPVGNTYAPADTYWLFWVLRHTRGSTRCVEPIGVANLRAVACVPSDDRLVVSLLNDTGHPVRLTVRSRLPREAQIRQLVRCSAWRQAGIVCHAEDTLAPAADVEACLPPGAVESYVWTLAEPALKAEGKVESREFFSKVVGRKFSETIEAPVEVSRLPRQDETVALRFAVSSDDLLAARGLAVALNGHERPVAWSDAPHEQQQGERWIWWMEVPVPRAQVEASNRVTFSKADAEYRLMFVSLVYRECGPTIVLNTEN